MKAVSFPFSVEKGTPPPVLAVVTNMRYGGDLLKILSDYFAAFQMIHPKSQFFQIPMYFTVSWTEDRLVVDQVGRTEF